MAVISLWNSNEMLIRRPTNTNNMLNYDCDSLHETFSHRPNLLRVFDLKLSVFNKFNARKTFINANIRYKNSFAFCLFIFYFFFFSSFCLLCVELSHFGYMSTNDVLKNKLCPVLALATPTGTFLLLLLLTCPNVYISSEQFKFRLCL